MEILQPNRCIFCERTQVPFTSEEHIVPEGIGNKEFVLPRGVVCDLCNNGPLSLADRAFLEFAPIAAMRVSMGVPTKTGSFPAARLGNAVLRQIDEQNAQMILNGRKALRRTADGFEADLLGRNMTPKYTAGVTRFLFKAALEFGYLDLGTRVVLGRKYDRVRRIALGYPYKGYLALARTATVHEQVSFTHWPTEIDGEDAIWAQIDAFGVVMGTELLQGRAPREPNLDQVVIIPF